MPAAGFGCGDGLYRHLIAGEQVAIAMLLLTAVAGSVVFLPEPVVELPQRACVPPRCRRAIAPVMTGPALPELVQNIAAVTMVIQPTPSGLMQWGNPVSGLVARVSDWSGSGLWTQLAKSVGPKLWAEALGQGYGPVRQGGSVP